MSKLYEPEKAREIDWDDEKTTCGSMDDEFDEESDAVQAEAYRKSALEDLRAECLEDQLAREPDGAGVEAELDTLDEGRLLSTWERAPTDGPLRELVEAAAERRGAAWVLEQIQLSKYSEKLLDTPADELSMVGVEDPEAYQEVFDSLPEGGRVELYKTDGTTEKVSNDVAMARLQSGRHIVISHSNGQMELLASQGPGKWKKAQWSMDEVSEREIQAQHPNMDPRRARQLKQINLHHNREVIRCAVEHGWDARQTRAELREETRRQVVLILASTIGRLAGNLGVSDLNIAETLDLVTNGRASATVLDPP